MGRLEDNMAADQCPSPPPPLNGFVDDIKSYRDMVIIFTCDPGYNLVGTSTLTCLSDGTWNGTSPTCTAVQCPLLSNPINGFVSGSNSYGDVANFTCEPGYKFVGTSSLTCLSDGTWNGKSPACAAVQCLLLSPPLNGFASGSNSYGEVVNFTCEPGYKLVGTSSLTCGSDGTWDGNSPTCTADRNLQTFDCQVGYRPVVGTCIRLSVGTKTYDDARQACIDDGGTLAMPKTKELDVALRNLVKTVGLNQSYWIGIKDVATLFRYKRRWQWEDGFALGNYQAWCPGEPCIPKMWSWCSRNCVQYWSSATGFPMWDDIGCHSSRRYICQAPAI
ncbi:hypothetical protein Bbelb_066000 [Branchiostoma belcheri]|nr:hypothetical protein Bbelb_066000 [Branchiostoma belcheri]